ncbi:MAG: hypothetical protein K0R24_2020 [Gammaproteobacteria bacterium]|jgi:hypothetical protein|nr:hypothetical protein [Gammaproteobacteria bacterium]
MPWISISNHDSERKKDMSMSHIFNDIFDDKKKTRPWYQKTKHVGDTQGYQELEVAIYQYVFRQKLIKANLLLIPFKKISSPHEIAASERLDICTKKYQISETQNAQELLQLTNSLIGLARKKLDKCHIKIQLNEKNIFYLKTTKTITDLKQSASGIRDDEN